MDQDEDSLEYTALVSAWAARDDLYARLPAKLDGPAIRALRRGRVAEAEHLPHEGQRMYAIQRARHWWPPEHGQ